MTKILSLSWIQLASIRLNNYYINIRLIKCSEGNRIMPSTIKYKAVKHSTNQITFNQIKQTTLAFLIFATPFMLQVSVAADNNFRSRAHQTVKNINTQSDIDAEVQFGKNIAARILGQFKEYKNKTLKRYVSLVGKSLAMNAGRDEIEFHFTVLDADFINAYSAPGGYIFITKGAIEAMRDESELAAVLAHEVAHITEKHIVNEFKIKGQDTSATAGLTNLLGSSSSSAKVAFTQSVDNAVNKLINKGFKKEEELEADKTSLLLLAATGYDTSSLRRYLKRAKRINRKTASRNQHKATHPPTSKRIKSLKRIAKQEGLNKLRQPKGTSRFKKYGKL